MTPFLENGKDRSIIVQFSVEYLTCDSGVDAARHVVKLLSQDVEYWER